MQQIFNTIYMDYTVTSVELKFLILSIKHNRQLKLFALLLKFTLVSKLQENKVNSGKTGKHSHTLPHRRISVQADYSN